MKNKKGFTLIELLVVVLIIGILAAIAVPKFQKSVWRSRAKSMLMVLKAMDESSRVYNLAHGVYPTKLSDLAINVAGYTKPCIYSGAMYSNDSCVANDYSNVFLNVVSGVNAGANMAYFNKGPYRSGGFIINSKNGNVKCYEHRDYISAKGDFCEKIMGCQENGSSGADFRFTCPNM